MRRGGKQAHRPASSIAESLLRLRKSADANPGTGRQA